MRILALLVLTALAAPLAAQDAAMPHWIWIGGDEPGAQRWFRRAFTIDGDVERAQLIVTCDDRCVVWLNGKRVLRHERWEEPRDADVRDRLRAGRNVLAIEAGNDGGPAALACRLDVSAAGGPVVVLTDERWLGVDEEEDGWQLPEYDDANWKTATDLGVVGDPDLQWTGQVDARSFGGVARREPPQPVRRMTDLFTRDGFVVEQVWAVPRTQGSWVSLTTDGRGRLLASDQKRGLFRITPAAVGGGGAMTTVEAMPVNLGGAQGLLWAFDGLYAVVNGPQSGLYRVRDSDGDDLLDDVELLRALDGSGEHGPHAVVLAPDGMSLFVIAGNHTDLTEVVSSRQPGKPAEDLLLPRHWDPRGHARGRLAPGGWICRVDPDGQRWQLWCAGFRNAYDIAFSPEGELFTYDADMEWDLGLPWYRPTRVCHAVSGAEFGWRSGSGKWPAYYADSLPPVVDMGPGSPTGVVFGTGAKFPARYQQALFVLDWTFGTIWAVHLTPDGASWTGDKEEFVSGQPLAVTDAVVGADGALYFTVGGRGTQSALYRIVYTGEAAGPVTAAVSTEAEAARSARRRLEVFHGRRDADAIGAAWPHLAAADRFLRSAARIAVEAQPVAEWRQRALAEARPLARVEAWLALARQGEASDLPALLAAMARVPWTSLERAERLTELRALELAFVRLGTPEVVTRRDCLERLDALYPSGDDDVDDELVQLLVFLEAPTVVEKTLPLLATASEAPPPDWAARLVRNEKYGGTIRRMLDNPPPARALRLAWALRNVRDGWTLPQRQEYLAFVRRLEAFPGGESYRGYVAAMREDALVTCSDAERAALAIDDVPVSAATDFEATPPKGPGQPWTVAAALEAVGPALRDRDFDSGRNLFHVLACATCHRFDGDGGNLGPDLSSVASRFAMRDLLEAIIEPSKVISDQYAAQIVETKDGVLHVGRVTEVEDGVIEVRTADPAQEPLRLSRAVVASVRDSAVSTMPAALVNPLNPDELRDLLAYLLSRGDPNHRMFKGSR